MTMTLKRGKTLGYVQEASLGAGVLANAVEFRFNDGAEVPTTAVLVEEQPNLGHENSFEYPDKPIIYRGVRESGLKIPMFLRRALTDASIDPPLATFMEAGGCEVGAVGGALLDGYTSAVAFSLDGDKAAIGKAIMVELSSGLHYPVLVADYTAAAAFDVVPAMGLPSASAIGKAASAMMNVSPMARAVPANKTLAFRFSTRGVHTTTEDLAFDLTGCALAGVENITFAPRQSVTMTCSFHVANVEQVAATLAAAAFVDGDKYMKLNNDFEFGFANANAAGAIANASASLINADVALGLTIIPVIGEGGADLNGAQGYLAYNEPPTVTLKMLLARARFAELEGTNANKYMHFVQAVRDLNDPAFGLWIPNAYLTDTAAEVFNDEYLTATLTYKGTAPKYGALTANGSPGMAPWVMAVGHVDATPA